MDEVENQQAVPESAPPETSPQEVAIQSTPQDDSQERNFRALREAKKEAERKAYELERKIKMQEEMMAQLLSKQPIQTPQVDEVDTVPDEDYIPKGHVKKLLKKERDEARKIAQEEVKKTLQEQEQSRFMERLKGKYPDFDDVVNPETLEMLEQQDPELASSIASMKDPYQIGMHTYKHIRSMGFAEKAPNARRVKEVEKKIEQNAKTVQSPQAYDKRPMAQTFQMTEALKQELYKEMMGFAKMASGVQPIG